MKTETREGKALDLVPIRVWFRWMARQRLILHNPASELELPRLGHRLPKHSAQHL